MEKEVGSFNPSPAPHLHSRLCNLGRFPLQLARPRESTPLQKDKKKATAIRTSQKDPRNLSVSDSVCIEREKKGNRAGVVTVYVKQSLFTRKKETCPVRAPILYMWESLYRAVCLWKSRFRDTHERSARSFHSG